MAAYQYVYVMKDLTKAYPGGREVFKGITLSFLPDVKIGVLGPNGAGKSTLMRIMAGQDKEFGGEAWAAEGVRVGYLSQEPHLEPDLTVGENVMLAFKDMKGYLDRFNEISMKFGEEMSDEEMNDLLAEQGDLQEKIDAGNGWEIDRTVEIALDALRCPPADSAGDHAVGRRAAARRAVPAAARKAGHAAARRADQPPRCRKRVLAGEDAARLHRRGADRDPRPLLPRQRHQLDPRGRSRPGHPLPGQLLLLPRHQAQAPAAGGARGEQPAAPAGRGAGMDRPRRPPPGSPRARRASPPTRICCSGARTWRPTRPRSRSRRRRGSATSSSPPTRSGRASATGC